jgi:hypothetical protein
MIKTDVKAEWLTRLRSGDYQQAHGALNRVEAFSSGNGAGYCCLGVLCEVLVDTPLGAIVGWRGQEGRIKLFGPLDGLPGTGSGVVLPDSVRHAIGLETDEQDALVLMNDDEHLDFEQIADWIEENL